MPNNEEYNRLVKSVRESSPDRRIAEDPRDWAFEVEEAIYEGEEKLKKTAYLFKDYIPDLDSYMAQKLSAYRAEINRIEMEFDQKEVQTGDIDRMVKDILDDFEDTYEVDAAEADFAKMAEEEPDVLLANAELILGREDTVELLSKATRKDPASALKYAAQYIEFYPYVLDAAILADPAAFEKYYPGFKDDRLYDPGYLMYSFDDMVKNPDAVCYFRTLAKYSPYGLLSEHETFEKFLKLPYAAEVLEQIDVENWFTFDEFYYQSILRASADINFYGAILHLLKQDDFRNYLYKHLAEFKKASPYMYEHVLWDIFYEDTQIAVRYFEENKNDKLYRKVLLEAIKNKFGIYYPHNQEAFTSMSYALSDLKDAAFYEEVIESVAPGFSIPIFLGFKSMMGVAEDPALRSILNIHRSWLPNMDTREFVNHSSWICRNLYFQNREVSESNVKDEYSRILTRKAELESLPLFSGRNIVLASHGENWGVKDAYQDRFGNYALQDRLQAQQGSGYEFKHFEPKSDTLSEIKKAKEESMNAIASTKPPLTYVFDGHGSKDSFFFSDGQLVDELTRQPVVETEKTIKVTYEEFAEILLKRRANFGDKALAKDIFIFSQCYNHNFVRKVNEILKSKGSTCPIMIGESEYNVSSLSDTESKYENYFYDDVLKLDQPSTTFGDLFNSATQDFNNFADSNFTVYVPDEKGTPMQLAKNDGEEKSAA